MDLEKKAVYESKNVNLQLILSTSVSENRITHRHTSGQN